MKGQKAFKIVPAVVGALLLLWFLAFFVDLLRANSNQKPVFAWASEWANDGGTVIYTGLGYRVIDFDRLNGYNEVKLGPLTMEYEDFEKDYNKLDGNGSLNGADVFYAAVEEIHTDGQDTVVLIKGLEVNDINHRGEFDFAVDENTEILWRGTKRKISDLKVGQNISVTSAGDVLERYPAGLTKVPRIIILNDEL